MKYGILFFSLSLIILLGCKFNRYNYLNIYGLPEKLLLNAQNIKAGEGRVTKISPSEFIKIKATFSKYGFDSWTPLTFIRSGKFVLKNKKNIIFSRKKKTIDGAVPVIVYDEANNLLYLIIADGIGG